MASVVDIRALGKKLDAENGSRKGSVNYLKLDHKVQIRPLGNIIEVCKFFVKRADGSSRSVCVRPEDVDEAARILSEQVGSEIVPQNRYAVNVIDRADGEIKVLENGISIFGVFGQWSTSCDIHPGSKDGWDWTISVKGSGFNRKYTPLPVKASPLTQDERKKIKEKNETYSLEDIYKDVPLDKLIEKVFGDRERESDLASASPASVPANETTDDDDDLLGSSGTKVKW